MTDAVLAAAKPAEPPWSPGEVSVFVQENGAYGFSNDYGIPFYTNDQDTSFTGGAGKIGCDDTCIGESWTPVFARTAAKPMGDWSVIVRPDNVTKQWAYKGMPVYNFFASRDPDEAKKIIPTLPHWHKLVPYKRSQSPQRSSIPGPFPLALASAARLACACQGGFDYATIHPYSGIIRAVRYCRHGGRRCEARAALESGRSERV
jgi:predicted lipoprotein with Yx(FWY)xxD motif